MKAWIGREMEGDSIGVLTLFVSGVIIEGDTVIKLLKQYPECKRLYLGGGRVDINSVLHLRNLLNFTDHDMDEVVVEVGFENYNKLPELLADEADRVIVRIDHPVFDLLDGVDVIKLDDGKKVHTIGLSKMIETDLEDLDKDLFKQDMLLYDDEIGGFI